MEMMQQTTDIGRGYFLELRLSLRVDDIKWAIKLKDTSHLYEYILDFQKIRKGCVDMGVDVKKFDEEVCNLTRKLKSVPLYR